MKYFSLNAANGVRLFIFSLLIGMVVWSCHSSSGSASDDHSLTGAGSTFVYPLLSKMFAEYHKVSGLEVTYQAVGSGAGIQQLLGKTVDFAGSDAPLSDEMTSKMKAPVLHIPMASGGAAVCYNLPELKDTLKLTPEVIADIYLGKITKWNDPKIEGINAGVKLPDMAIAVVHRSEASGTTYIWTDYLSKVSETWKTNVGKSSTVKWPVGEGSKGNDGVARLIKKTPGSIGYLELSYTIQYNFKQTPGAVGYVERSYAVRRNLTFAKVQNMKGRFISPDLNSITAAGDVDLPADAKVSLTNTENEYGYPICGFTWILIYKEQKYNDRERARAFNLLKLLWWNIHDGQHYCQGLNYAKLSPPAIKVAEDLLKSATYDSEPIL